MNFDVAAGVFRRHGSLGTAASKGARRPETCGALQRCDATRAPRRHHLT